MGFDHGCFLLYWRFVFPFSSLPIPSLLLHPPPFLFLLSYFIPSLLFSLPLPIPSLFPPSFASFFLLCPLLGFPISSLLSSSLFLYLEISTFPSLPPPPPPPLPPPPPPPPLPLHPTPFPSQLSFL